MPKQRIDNFEFWYGTPDAPAPSGNLSDDEPSLVVGTSSDIAAQAVAVRYRDMGERWQDLRQVSVDHKATGHFVRIQFPPLKLRARIEYEVLASIAGKEPQQIGPRQTFRVTESSAPVRVSNPSGIISVATARKLSPPTGEVRSEVASQPASDALARAGKVAGLSNEATHTLTSKAPDTSLFDDATARELVAEGAIEEAAADKLAVAAIALNVTDGDEDAAGKVMTELARRGVTKPRDLAAMTSEEMTAAFERAGAASHEVAVERAARLRAGASKAFPSEALAPARISLPPFPVGSGKQPVSVKPEVIDRAWKNNTGLDLLRMDLFKDSADRRKLNLAGLTPAERKAFIRDIHVRQGELRAGQSADIAEKLLKGGITSPAAVSPARVAKETGISLARAKNVHERDIRHDGRLSHGLFTLLDAHSGGLQDTAVGNLRRIKVVDFVRRAETHETFDGLENIQELFGDVDSCDCKHCNSILGPAAYLVDLMHFVQTHVLDEDVVEGDDPAPFKGKQGHRLHLKTRRPDLWVLPLTCENTHTEIPQLEITTEIFENFIAKKRGIAITPDRRGVAAAVYGSILPGGRHSVLQPFHLAIEALEIYLSHFKIRRSDIVELLDEPEAVQLHAVMGLSRVHVDLITISDPSPVNIHNKLGITLPADGILTMRKLLDATRVSRKDLGEILESTFVGGPQPLSIIAEKKSPDSVQFDIERVHGVTLGHLDRIHRLLRLQRHLPWLPEELDGFIASAGGSLDSSLLADAGRAAILKGRFKASLHDLCALAGDLPNFSVERRNTLADKAPTPADVLFNVPSLMREDGPYPNASIRYSANETSNAAQERSLRLRAGLRLDEGSLAALVDGLTGAFEAGTPPSGPGTLTRFFGLRLRALPRPTMPASIPPKLARPLPLIGGGAASFPLNGHNLTLLFRHAVLARWLKLSVTDRLTLIRLTPGVGNHVVNLREALEVVRFSDWWKSTPLSLEDLTLLLAPVEAVQEQIEDIWEAERAWLQEQEPTYGALTDTFLTQVEGVSEELSREIVALNTGKVFGAAGNGFRVVASALEDDLDLTPLKNTAVEARKIRDLVRGYHPNERVPRALTEALKTDIGSARAILAAVSAGTGRPTAHDFLQDGPSPDALKPLLAAILRMHGIVSALRLTPASLTFFAEHQTEFGISNWVEPNLQALRRVTAVQALLKTRFGNDPASALAQVARVLADPAVLPEVAIVLSGLEPAFARDLIAKLRIPENGIDAFFRVERYAEIATKLSIDATALSGLVSEDYARASAASAAVLAGFRAKYLDEATWTEKIEPYQERVLEKKRDALIDYLLHGPDAEFPSASEMYKYFLIDGEVDGCFRTSRVVAASSSLQLYVHRIRMNLEKEPNGGLHVQPSLILDEEWEWRQHYRIWEANRKIFLWPENYLDPTTRDNKTPLFEGLESELLQQEVTEQTVIDAYSNYLKGLEELANLRFAGAYHHYTGDEDEGSGEITDILYLFGATGGDAPTHYWREIRNFASSQKDELVSPEYGPWRKVETRIPTRHVSPVVYDGQLHVFWNQITTISQNAVHSGTSRFVGYSHRYALKFTSLRLDGQWTPPEGVSLQGASPTFKETASSIDDPLAEKGESPILAEAFLSSPWFGIFSDPEIKALEKILTPRWGIDMHTKVREGYSVDGFMWERPYLSADPSYGHRLLVNCAGLTVRGVLDLFDRRILWDEAETLHWHSLLAYRNSPSKTEAVAGHGGRGGEGLPSFPLLIRESNSLWQTTWSGCQFDYPVASTLALNAGNLTVFENLWDVGPGWSSARDEVANVSDDAGVWSVAGTPGETIIETEDESFLLQPSATVANHYVLHRLGTTLVRNLARKLSTGGLDALLDTSHQLDLSEPNPDVTGPRTHDRTVRNPIANDASYGTYYQEIFQHIPLLIAHHLNAKGKFGQAQRWYHYVFDPTSPEPPTHSEAPETDRNWKYRQFRGQEQVKLRDVLSDTAAVQKYRKDPFNAHAIARLRVSAYQKAVVMRYIDNLLDWADERFARFQMETVNEAMMLYVTAGEVLGPRPLQLGECGELRDHTRTYDKLKDSILKDREILIEVEELIPRTERAVPTTAGPGPLKPVFGLKGLLAFRLGKAGVTVSSSEPSVAGGGKPAAVVRPGLTASVAADGVGAKPSQPKPGLSFIPMAMAPAFQPVREPAPGKTKIGGIGKAAVAGDLMMGAIPFRKTALVQPRSEALDKAFELRQQVQFPGGGWKLNGGRFIPSTLGDRFARAVVRQVSAAFCIPRNEIFEDYWNRVEDRIQKLRTCRDITGRKRKLSLFAPPIDPALLARARAAGISLDDALSAFDGMIPQYRFPYLLQKAKEFTGTVQSFGVAL